MIVAVLRVLGGSYATVREKLFGGYSPLRRLWRRYRPLWVWERTSSGRANAAVVKRHGLEVMSGPFKGMRYPQEAVGRTNMLGVKLLGVYELELRDVLEAILHAGFTRVINIGAGEGFYAVGLALRCPGCTVHAFETDAGERRVCRLIAEHNRVLDRLQIEGSCDVRRLSELGIDIGDAATLVVCDCEGCELELLRPAVVSLLQKASLLVELHPSVDAAIPGVIQDRFRATHTITLIRGAERPDVPGLSDMDPSEATLLMSEGRGGEVAEWAYLTPHANS